MWVVWYLGLIETCVLDLNIMIKIYSMLLSTMVFVVSCSQYSEGESSILTLPDSDLSFGVEVPQSTRGRLVDSQELMASMGVYCAYTTDLEWSEQTEFDRMEDESLLYDVGLSKWIYEDDTQQWDFASLIDLYTFMAYSPYGDGATISPKVVDGALVVEYTVSEDYASQPDLMMAIPRKDIYPQAGGVVALEFLHTLSAIGFSVKGLSTQIITDISIRGVVASGEVSVSDDGEVEWSLGSRSRVRYSAGIASDVEPNVYTAEGLTLDDGYLMMIPQELDRVRVVVTISNADSSTETISLDLSGEWESGRVYDYTINLSNYDYTIEGTSNCYMLHPNGENQTFYIPVEGRINTFWRDYADDSGTYENMLSSSDEWEATLLWSDFNGNTNGFSVERVTSGFSPSETVTYLCEPDFTTLGARSAMKITLPSNIDEGNFLVAVTCEDKILWSWHLWVSEYNPDEIAASSCAEQGVYVYTKSGVDGEVHRYDEEDLWATLYDSRFIMDRNLGARDSDYSSNRDGVLHYQFGRKDPFPSDSSLSPTVVNSCVTFAEAVQSPTTFYTRTSEDYSWSEEGLSMGSQYLWFDKSVANDPSSSGKSIFDPSPLGWRVPRYGVFAALDNSCNYDSQNNLVLYRGVVKLPMTGYRSNNTGNVNDYGSQGNLRVSTQINSSRAYNMVYDPSADDDKTNTLSDGFCVRCIEE